MRRTCVLLPLFFAAASAGLAAQRALLIDGPSNGGRDWNQESGPVKAILESLGGFQVDVETATAHSQPVFEKYKLVVLNYGGDAWPSATLAALDKYVTNGGGIVALPGADSAFPDSPSYNLMLGVAAAANRDEHAGPLWFYRNGNVAYDDTTPGKAGNLIPPGEPFLITIRDTEHPITKGLPLSWLHVPDELAGRVRGPGKNMVLLLTAFSDPAKGGTGLNEPQMVAVTYGKGRIFHTLLGRTAEAWQGVGLRILLARGAQWAATGKVTLKPPADFPTEQKVSQQGP
jgi:uncharacterized protein